MHSKFALTLNTENSSFVHWIENEQLNIEYWFQLGIFWILTAVTFGKQSAFLDVLYNTVKIHVRVCVYVCKREREAGNGKKD